MKVAIGILLMLSSLLSCSENNDIEGSIIEGSAIINRIGEENEGDCGFFLQFKDSLYKPINLAKEYQINALSVEIKFELLNELFICGDIPEPPYQRSLKKIRILEIREE